MAGPDVQTSVCILLTRPLNVSLSSSSGQRWGLLLWRGSFDLNFKLQGSASSDVSWSAFHVKLFIRCLKKKRGCEWCWSWSHHYKPSPPTLRCRTRGTCAGTNEDLIVMCPNVLSAVLFRCTNVNNMATLLCCSAKLWNLFETWRGVFAESTGRRTGRLVFFFFLFAVNFILLYLYLNVWN